MQIHDNYLEVFVKYVNDSALFFLFTCRTSGTLNIHARGAHDLQKLKPGSKGTMLIVQLYA